MGADSSLGAAYLPQKANLSETGGTKLSESAVLHVGVGAEAGYDSNVFFQQTNPKSSPLIRIIPFLELTNASRGGAQPTGAYYDLSATLLYREFITGDTATKAQRAFNPVISGLLDLNPQSPLNFSVSEQFARFEDPPYTRNTSNITRVYNLAALQMRYAPGGGRLQLMMRYSNAVNVFETKEYEYANHMAHDVTLDVSWRWFPKTALFLQASQGYIDYFHPNEGSLLARRNSYPLRVVAGLRGLVTNKTTLYFGLGYLNGFYSGTNTTGLSNLGVVGEISYTPTLLTKVLLGYRREFRNSPVIGNFYDVDTPYLQLSVNLATRFVLSAFARYEYRRYHGLVLPNEAIQNGAPQAVQRNDNVFQSGTQADFFLAHWFYLGASYIATINDSNLPESRGGLHYTKHLILGRVGVTY